jgi:cell division protein FtsI (penicillin-binding protein 3)
MQETTNHDKKRIYAIALGLFLLFSIAAGRYWYIQVSEEGLWTKRADRQQHRVVQEGFRRGTIFANSALIPHRVADPQPLVIDVQKYHLYIDPLMIPEEAKKEMARHLLAVTETKECDKKRFITSFFRQSRSRKIASFLGSEQRDAIILWWQDFAKKHQIVRNALFFVDDFQRSYPFGPMLGQVLHTIRGGKDEKTMQGVPTGGLELQYNKYLQGKPGKKILAHSPRHVLEMGTIVECPQDGADIYLTVNHELQALMENELAMGVEKAQAKGGWAIMMDPYTGEILACAQYPFFDPRRYSDYFNKPELIEDTKVKAITDANEMGSMMKPITIAIALKANKELKKRGEAPLFDPQEKIAVSDGTLPGRRKKMTDVHLHYFLNMEMGIWKSSNIYMAKLADRIVKRMGNQWYRDQLALFGFGSKTGIELPCEVEGLLPRIGKCHPNGALEWSTPTPYSLAIGHNIQVTTMQIMRAYALFANGGYLVKPTLVKKIVTKSPDGCEEVAYESKPELSQERIIDPDVLQEVVKAMKFTTKKGGSAFRADIWGYTEAGKTGTAEKVINGHYSKDHNLCSFIGFAPIHKPRFVLIVAIDEPAPLFIPGFGKNSRGGQCAAPVFREIGKRALAVMGVPPDDPCGYPVGDPRHDKSKSDWYKETEALRELYEKWNKK